MDSIGLIGAALGASATAQFNIDTFHQTVAIGLVKPQYEQSKNVTLPKTPKLLFIHTKASGWTEVSPGRPVEPYTIAKVYLSAVWNGSTTITASALNDGANDFTINMSLYCLLFTPK